MSSTVVVLKGELQRKMFLGEKAATASGVDSGGTKTEEKERATVVTWVTATTAVLNP